jgi:8-oxo-dGTP diphosphatase
MSGTWGLPGGHLEYGEKLKVCAVRELYEETGIKGKNLTFAGIHNWFQKADGRHYIFTVFKMENKKDEPQIMEPDKCSEWKWFDSSKLPKNICLPHRRDLKIFLKNKNFLD